MIGWRTRAAASLLAVCAVALLTRGSAVRPVEAGPDTLGDSIRAARLLDEWRFDEARALIASLRTRAPRAAETRYLEAELAFLDGHYDKALEHLQGLVDRAADASDADSAAGQGNVTSLRRLATQTMGVTRGFARYESPRGHFAIHYPPGKDEALVELAGEVLEAAHQALTADFGPLPAERVRVEILTKPADLAALSTLTEAEIETTGTIALCKYGKLMVVSPRATLLGYPWMDTLVHEYVHYVISRMSHDKVPVWLHEGLARFEQSRWRRSAPSPLTTMDQHLLALALEQRRLISFDEMHPSMAKLPSQEAAALAFAEVQTMVAYLHSRVGYPGLQRIIALQRDGKSAQRAVGEVMGARFSRVERDWKTYLQGLGLQPSKTLAGRARAPRIRFDRGGEKGDNVGVDEVTSRKARQLARLGGMLRARDMPAAAAVEYEKALALGGVVVDPFVAAKLSRTYLDLSLHEKAVALAEPLHRADEDDAGTAVTLGLSYRALGRLEDARAALSAALRVSPFDPAVRCALAEIHASLGETTAAARERKACDLLRP